MTKIYYLSCSTMQALEAQILRLRRLGVNCFRKYIPYVPDEIGCYCVMYARVSWAIPDHVDEHWTY